MTLQAIPDGPEGVYHTLKIMRQLAREGKKSPIIRQLALSLVRGNHQKDWVGEVKNLHAFVRDKIRYVKDIEGVETVALPEITLQLEQGDCDDKSVLLASLLGSIGHPTRFVAIGFKPRQFSHVFVETKIGDKWIPLETTEPVSIGWTPKGVVERHTIHN